MICSFPMTTDRVRTFCRSSCFATELDSQSQSQLLQVSSSGPGVVKYDSEVLQRDNLQSVDLAAIVNWYEVSLPVYKPK